MKRNRKKGVSKLDKLLEIPDELISNEPKITIVAFNKCLIENYKSILEYQEFYIRLSTYIGIININGFNMQLNEMTNEDLLIEGKIESIDFESTIENREE